MIPKLNLRELQLVLVSIMKFIDLKQPFEIYQIVNFKKITKFPRDTRRFQLI